METGKRETVYVFQKLSAYMLWILITKPTHCLSSISNIQYLFIIYMCVYMCVCVLLGKLRTYLFSFGAIHFILNLVPKGQREACLMQLKIYKTVPNKYF